MSKKLRGIGVQLVGFFVLAILIPTLILAFRAIETTKSAQTENLKLTSVQTLQETKMGFTNYLKNISQPIDLLTRNDAVKHLEDRGDYDTNVTIWCSAWRLTKRICWGNRQSDGVLRDRYGFRAECNFNKMLIKY